MANAINVRNLDRWQKDYKGKKITLTSAIRLKCLDCTGNQQAEVRLCPAVDCPLWVYRMGHGFDPAPKKALMSAASEFLCENGTRARSREK